MSKKRYTEKEREDYVRGWRESGKSIIGFAKEKGLAQATLSYWIQKTGNRKNSSSFVEIKGLPGKEPETDENKYIIIEKRDIKITVPIKTETKVLQDIVEVLEGCR